VLKRLLFENLFAKILALLVSVLLWFYVTEQQVFQETLSVPLRLENIPESLILLGDVPEEVEVLVQGQGRFLRHRVRGLYMALDMAGASKGRYVRRLTAADVTVPVEEDVEVLEVVQPSTLSADLDRAATKTVPVLPATESSPASGYARVGAAVVNPETVTIRGAESVVAGVNSLRTEPISLRDANRMVVARAKVDLGGLERVRCDPEQVAVALPVEKIEAITLGRVAVAAMVDTTRWEVRWDPEEVETIVRGPVSALVGLRETLSAMQIDARPLTAGRYFFDLKVEDDGGMALARREPEPTLPDSTDTTAVLEPVAPPEPIRLEVTFDLPTGVRVSEVTPSQFHIVVEELGRSVPEAGELLLSPS